MRVTVKLFGNEAATANRREVTLDLPGPKVTVAEVRERLAAAVPELADAAQHCRVAVNHEFADESVTVQPDDEIALIGQVSGG